MKKIFLLAILAFSLFACEDNLSQAPISEPSAANFYRDADDFEQAVNGVYNVLNYYATAHFMMADIRSDIIYSPGTGVRNWNPINNFSKSLASNGLMNSAWNDPYRGIFFANTVLDKITEDLVPESEDRDRMIGESKFLRAVFYFDLVRFFGKVPVYDRVVSPAEALEIGRAPVSEVYDLIVSDLNEAISLLPIQAAKAGRASSVVAKAMLARVYLTMSGPTYNIEGPGLGVDKKSDALSLLNDVIASDQFSWVDDYATIFGYNTEDNGDIVFSAQNINDGNTGNRGIGTGFPRAMYHEEWAFVNMPFGGGVPGDSPINPSEQFLSSFESSDVRDDFSIQMSYLDGSGTTINSSMFVKFLSMDHLPADGNNFGIDLPIIRYTDVLMMKAEILLQTGGSQTDVDAIVNKVRERAGASSVSNVTLDQLLDERAREFMVEGLRWHDLVRTGKVLDVMNTWEKLDDTSGKIVGIDANDIIYPIHQSQLDVKDGLYEQNLGY